MQQLEGVVDEAYVEGLLRQRQQRVDGLRRMAGLGLFQRRLGLGDDGGRLSYRDAL